MDNKLLLQIFLLKEETGKTWPYTEAFLHKILGREVAKDRMRTLTEKAVRDLERLTSEAISSFLDTVVDIDGLGELLTNAGFTKDSLLSSSFEVLDSTPSNGLLIELGKFQKKHQMPNGTLLHWFCLLTGVTVKLPDGSAAKMHRWVNDLTAQLKKLQSNRGKTGGSGALEAFRSALFAIPDMFPTSSSSTSETQSNNAPAADKNGGLHSKLAALRRQHEESEHLISSLTCQINVLAEEKKALTKEIAVTAHTNADLTGKVVTEKERAAQLQQDVTTLQTSIRDKDQQLRALKKDNAVRRNTRLQNTIRQLRLKTIQMQQMINKATQQKVVLNNRRYYVQRTLQMKGAQVLHERTRKLDLRRENRHLRQRILELEGIAGERRVIRLKDPDTGYFTEDAKVCIMQLVGQHEIAAGRCGEVIQTFCRTVLHAEVPEGDLPSERSVGRFLDMGQVIAKMHVGDAITKSERFDLHTDGTSKVGKKIVGHQVTTADGQTLSCGYTVVASENADCLVTVATDMLEELAIIYENDDGRKQEKFLEFFEKLSSVMSDRAAVMKCFGSRLDDLRKDLLQTEEDIKFLYCNAHFLLGLVSGVDKAFKDQQQEGDQPVGRDSVAKFAGRRIREHPVSRYIREACALLGPRGDERFGCRESWLAYCMLIGCHSTITSFKANRFNNLFQASAALHFHQQDIGTFLDTCMAALNWKQEGILLDSRSTIIDNHLIALGLMYFRLTGPYWRLLGKSIHVLDFYKHVEQMTQFLKR